MTDMQREVENSPRGNNPEDSIGSELTYNKQLCSILQQVILRARNTVWELVRHVSGSCRTHKPPPPPPPPPPALSPQAGLLLIDDPAQEAALLRSDAKLVLDNGDAAKAKLVLETAAVLDAQAAAIEGRTASAATVNTERNAALMARLMATSINTSVLATCNVRVSADDAMSASEPAAMEDAPVTVHLPSPHGADTVSHQLSRTASYMTDDDLQVREPSSMSVLR